MTPPDKSLKRDIIIMGTITSTMGIALILHQKWVEGITAFAFGLLFFIAAKYSNKLK